jgi:very-long-chain enoyl-CoA reductase
VSTPSNPIFVLLFMSTSCRIIKVSWAPTCGDADSKYYPERQRMTLPLQPGQVQPAPIDERKKLKDSFTTDRPQVVFKDLGPQLSYRLLFFFEYLGPLIVYPIFYYYPQVYTLFGVPERSFIHPVQTYALYAWCFHYLTREFETIFVHRFSDATCPLANVYRNCAYYWAFAGVIAYLVNHPDYNPVGETQMHFGFAVSILSQLSNYCCHIILRNLGAADENIGSLLSSIACANCTTDIMQWVGFNIATQTMAGFLFLTGILQITCPRSCENQRHLTAWVSCSFRA